MTLSGKSSHIATIPNMNNREPELINSQLVLILNLCQNFKTIISCLNEIMLSEIKRPSAYFYDLSWQILVRYLSTWLKLIFGKSSFIVDLLLLVGFTYFNNYYCEFFPAQPIFETDQIYA